MKPPASSWHSKKACSEAVNSNVASVLGTEPYGPEVIVVSGGWSVLAKSGPQNVPEAAFPNHATFVRGGCRRQRAGVGQGHQAAG